ncbi:MAG: hypothetical protein ACKERG_02720 [Candidatus Hodgkinia cicadicola]
MELRSCVKSLLDVKLVFGSLLDLKLPASTPLISIIRWLKLQLMLKIRIAADGCLQLAKLIKGLEVVLGLVVSSRKADAVDSLLKYGVLSLETQRLKRTLPKLQPIIDYHTAFYSSRINDALATAAHDACASSDN